MGRVLGFVLVLCLLGGAGFAAWTWYEKNHAAADPDALPALTKDDATRTYLDGKGKVVQDMFDATPELVADPARCEKQVKVTLVPLGSPNELSAAASKVPDPTARDLALAHVGLLTEYVAACGKKGADSTERVGGRLKENKESFDELMGAAS